MGLARVADPRMTGYVVTRYYRAPEVMLNWQSYDEKIDIWSAGCIFAEILTRRVLFEGQNPVDQFFQIAKVCGKPPPEVIASINEDYVYLLHFFFLFSFLFFFFFSFCSLDGNDDNQ